MFYSRADLYIQDFLSLFCLLPLEQYKLSIELLVGIAREDGILRRGLGLVAGLA